MWVGSLGSLFAPLEKDQKVCSEMSERYMKDCCTDDSFFPNL